ncbi:MAG: hypothetical protein ACRDGO_03495 [Actinomycetota bacterium]
MKKVVGSGISPRVEEDPEPSPTRTLLPGPKIDLEPPALVRLAEFNPPEVGTCPVVWVGMPFKVGRCGHNLNKEDQGNRDRQEMPSHPLALLCVDRIVDLSTTFGQ